MIYELGRKIAHWVKSVLHFFRALFCDEWEWLERYGGICSKESRPYTRICYCRYYNCPKLKGADDEYERAVEQTQHDALYEPTYNSEDGSM